MNPNQNVKTTEPDGVLILDKPAGMTSHDCVAIVRRLYRTKKVGHTGTLDPMATGVLPILIGRAAKAAEYLTAENKHYIAGLKLGVTTDTEDTTGTVLSACTAIPDEQAVREAVGSFVGEILQVPPMYSALKIGGQKLVDLARQGVTVERQARPITVYSIGCERQAHDRYLLDVVCSKGTYIRTLCADVGARLGCGGAMASLRRAGSGAFTLEDAVTLDALEAMEEAARLSLLRPTESLFSALEALYLPPFFERLCANGQPVFVNKLLRDRSYVSGAVSAPAVAPGMRVRIVGAEKGFFAVGEVCESPDGICVRPVKKFVL